MPRGVGGPPFYGVSFYDGVGGEGEDEARDEGSGRAGGGQTRTFVGVESGSSSGDEDVRVPAAVGSRSLESRWS